MDQNRYCVIMAGGVGSRFWPMSRQNKPKQFIDILGNGETLLQATWRRASEFCLPENIVVVSNEIYEDLIRKQLPDINPDNILSEPVRRDTAPCVAYAAYKISLKNPDAVMSVIPSDHLISKESEFIRVMNKAYEEAAQGEKLLTLGIQPTRPDTGYGYIQFDVNGGKLGDGKFKPVKLFTEKPNEEMARTFIASGEFVWNSGMFVWTTKNILAAFEEFQPEIIALFKENPEVYYTPAEKEFINTIYTQCKSISIDYGIMEKAENVFVMGADLGWSDLGTWGSLYEKLQKGDDHNAIVGKNVMTFDTKGCLVNCPKEKLVVLGSIKNLIVTEYDDMLLICKIDEEQKIKHYVNEIKISKGGKVFVKNILAILVLLICGTSVFAQITQPKKTFYFQKNAALSIKNNDEAVVEVSIEAGKNLVFFYEWKSAKNPQIADADRTDKLYFEITPEQAKSFEASGSELSKVSTIRCRLCFCLEGGCRRNTKGILTVKKVSCGKYAVTFKDEPDSEKMLVNETFTLKKGE